MDDDIGYNISEFFAYLHGCIVADTESGCTFDVRELFERPEFIRYFGQELICTDLHSGKRFQCRAQLLWRVTDKCCRYWWDVSGLPGFSDPDNGDRFAFELA